MSIESLRRVLKGIQATAKEMRKEKHAKRLAPKPKEEKPDAKEQIRELLTEK